MGPRRRWPGKRIGGEFGGSNPEKLARVQERWYEPLGAHLTKIPPGKKGYNGRVERSHRIDDEEFYIPQPAGIHNRAGWIYFYNLVRPHYGEGWRGSPPFQRLGELGYDLPKKSALFPPIILDRVGVDWTLD